MLKSNINLDMQDQDDIEKTEIATKQRRALGKYCASVQPRSQGFSLDGGRGGKMPWHRLVTCST